MPIELVSSRTALLCMDLQAAIVSIYAGEEAGAFVARVAGVLQAARTSGVRVIHVRVGFRPGLPEVGPGNKLFTAVKQSSQHQKLFSGATGEIHAALSPEESEAVVVKHRVSAFAGTDLEMILRANAIDTLILLGIATSGVVLSTALEASDADYRLVVLGDCCADLDQDLHTCLLEKLLPTRADVLSSAQLIEALSWRSQESSSKRNPGVS